MNLEIFAEVQNEIASINSLFSALTSPLSRSNLNPPLDGIHRTKVRSRWKEKEGREAGKGRKARLTEGRPAGCQEDEKRRPAPKWYRARHSDRVLPKEAVAPKGWLDRETRSLEIEVKYLDKEKARERLATGNRRADGMRSQTKLGRPRRICSPP